MDDSCAVCAETLEWVAYGSCGHKDVCSTCVARLRFICDDRRCCICKTESSVVFVTKALGDYTRMINDFSVFPTEGKEGRMGSYWYHEDTQAYFDDLDHYKMIKAMCRLSCSVCDKMEDQVNDGPKRRAKFRNIGQLKGHLFHQHKLQMCSLCLEGRKVFICEQKLYTRAQMKQHISTGDSEVDGTESERGGFMGHPLCEFCRSPFYGDNELYSHMSTEHYTCHLCQRQHPGQYEYYKNYDDLEMHFRQDHFLCEDEACLAKKFVVFQSEAEMKRHNALEHGGRMSRSQRNAALQIPTSFRYRRSTEQDNRRGRGRTFHRDLSDAELSHVIEASFETANTDSRFYDSLSSNRAVASDRGDTNDSTTIIQPFESSSASDSEPPSRYLQACANRSSNGPLVDSSFPPLPSSAGVSQQRPINDPGGFPKGTLAEKLRGKGGKGVRGFGPVNVLHSAPWPRGRSKHGTPAASTSQSSPAANNARAVQSISAANGASGSSALPARSKPATINQRSAASDYSTLVQAHPSSVHEPSSSKSSAAPNNLGGTSRISHSTSAPNLVETGSLSDFPPVSSVQARKLPANGQGMKNAEGVYAANKSMVERIRAALDFDHDKFSAFKEISGEYRQGSIDASTYLAYVEQFCLTDFVLELAGLCPDPRKERELVEAYTTLLSSNVPQENGRTDGSSKGKSAVTDKGKSPVSEKVKPSVTEKGKSVVENSKTKKDNLTDSILSSVRELQSNYKPAEEVEMLSKDGYRAAKGKSKLVVDEQERQLSSASLILQKPKDESFPSLAGGGSNQSVKDGDGRSKQRKKTSKFIRARLGENSMAALVDLKDSDTGLDTASDTEAAATGGGLPVRGVWRNNGGHKLLAKASRNLRN